LRSHPHNQHLIFGQTADGDRAVKAFKAINGFNGFTQNIIHRNALHWNIRFHDHIAVLRIDNDRWSADRFYRRSDGKIGTKTNYSGGIQGGISTGEPIYFRVAFKPVATIMKDQQTVDESGKSVMLNAKGRHDPCVLPRAVPIVEAMAAMVILDYYLMNKGTML